MKNSSFSIPIVAVSGCLFHDNHVLLIKRGRMPSKGLWSLPGGKINFGESLEDAVRREIFEETGVTIEQPVFFNHQELIRQPSQQNSKGSHYILFVYYAIIKATTPPTLIIGDDADDGCWVLPKCLNEYKLTTGIEKTVRQIIGKIH